MNKLFLVSTSIVFLQTIIVFAVLLQKMHIDIRIMFHERLNKEY